MLGRKPWLALRRPCHRPSWHSRDGRCYRWDDEGRGWKSDRSYRHNWNRYERDGRDWDHHDQYHGDRDYLGWDHYAQNHGDR
ncbi:hypothetical protein AV521_08690 [Streptomyces sp. IMTB 2501]|uniref:hypothetical protein n=1 Tax=Streptomyces sp. IMTB 2501 TaxID=1776340 RepID=UPI00096BF8E3|nr:hypothetical protein [Streptomyces sp. IMTB 2501]OLZ72005.1 hypothetical protein AV521_08690 [Streptomyces sp. IMTB 2501]